VSPDALGLLPTIVAARAVLDEALVAARTLSPAEVATEAVVEALADALQRTYGALAAVGDAEAFHDARLGAAASARAALEGLQTLAATDPRVDEVAQSVARALRLLLGASLTVLDPAPVLPRATELRPPARASLDEPRLLDLQRDVLRPAVPLPEREAPPEPPAETAPPSELAPAAPDLAALREEARASLRALDARDEETGPEKPRPPAAPPAPADPERVERSLFGDRLTAMDVLFDHARGCLEDLGAFGLARRPMEPEPWWCPRTEARLLTRVDALAACGEAVLPWLVRLLEERPVPDPELTWAVVFLFGCIAGDDAVDQAMRIARLTPLDAPALRESVADALTHVPHPGVESRLRPWLDDPTPGRREAAIVALGRRGLLSPVALAAFARDPDVAVARAAVEAFPLAMPREALADALAHPAEAVLGAALDAAARSAPDLAARRAAELMRAHGAERGDAAMHVAIGTGEEGLAILHGGGELTPTRCEALGWYGHVASVGVLLQGLAHPHKPTVASAALALWRITGAPLTDDEPAPAPAPESFKGATWEDDELPECPVELCLAPGPWSAWWAAHGAGADPSLRWRCGRRWRVDDNARVLSAKASRPRDRRWAALELASRTGRRLPFEAWRFIPRQLAQIAAWREAAARRPTDAGWAVPGGTR